MPDIDTYQASWDDFLDAHAELLEKYNKMEALAGHFLDKMSKWLDEVPTEFYENYYTIKGDTEALEELKEIAENYG